MLKDLVEPDAKSGGDLNGCFERERGLALPDCIDGVMHDANPSAWTYCVHLKFGWSPAEAGCSVMFPGLFMGLIYDFVIRIAIARLGKLHAASVKLVCGAAGFDGYAFATSGWMIYAWMVV